MNPYHLDIEVEYTLRERNRRPGEIPAEYYELINTAPRQPANRPSRFLLLLAELLIKAGNALKNGQQVKVTQNESYL